MRFIRNFVVLFILILSLTAASPIYAADSYFNVSGCPDEATSEPCLISGDGVNTNVPLSKLVTYVAATLAELLGPKTTLWAGKLWPKDSYLIGKEKLTTYGNQVQTASDTDLNPAQLQETEQHDQTPKPFSMTSRLCVYDPSTGALVADTASTTTVKSVEVPWIKPKVEGDRRLSSFTTRYVQESQDFGLPYIMIHQDAALPCGLTVSGETKPQNDTAYRDDNTYGNNLIGGFLEAIVHVVAETIRTITVIIDGEESTTYEGDAPIRAEIVGTGQNPFTGHDSALSAGCATSSDLDDVTYATAEQKQKLCEAGGVVNSMYRPDAIDPTYRSPQLDADDPTQQWVQTVTGGDPIAENSNAFAARVEAAGDYMNCTLMPADYQNKLPDGAACNKNWVSATAGPPTAGGWNCNTNVGEQSVAGLNTAAGQSYADRVWGSCASGTENAWKLCKDDVIARAIKACVNPLFALAIWLHESGASNYICGQQLSGGKVQDFGINVPSIAENFSAQLDRFLLLPSSYAARCPKTLRDFVALFWFGNGCYNSLSASNKAKVDGYIGELQLIYSTIAPGVSLPTWPGGC